jgi:putative glutamine amidotransferase
VFTDYLKAVAQAGGRPVLLPILAKPELSTEIVPSLDGILLTGGGDLDPSLFGELPYGKIGEICPQRDRCDLLLARTALAGNIPLLAVCRGIQVLNVACGGTTYQDIGAQAPEAFNHMVTRVPECTGYTG